MLIKQILKQYCSLFSSASQQLPTKLRETVIVLVNYSDLNPSTMILTFSYLYFSISFFLKVICSELIFSFFMSEVVLKVLYGSETGTAEDVSFQISRLVRVCSIPVRVASLEDYDVLDLPSETVVLFIVSTTGDGDVPSAMKSFWKFLLQKQLASDSLKSLKFTVFGLGDSSYEKYNAAAR